MSFGQYFIRWLSICSREVQVTTKMCASCSEVVGEHESLISAVIIVVKYLKDTQPRDYFVWKQSVVQGTSRVTLQFLAKWQRQCVRCCQPGHATSRHCTDLQCPQSRHRAKNNEASRAKCQYLNCTCISYCETQFGQLLDVWFCTNIRFYYRSEFTFSVDIFKV